MDVFKSNQCLLLFLYPDWLYSPPSSMSAALPSSDQTPDSLQAPAKVNGPQRALSVFSHFRADKEDVVFYRSPAGEREGPTWLHICRLNEGFLSAWICSVLSPVCLPLVNRWFDRDR